MFGSSKGLTNVPFKNCELSSLVGLVSDSEIECVTFEGCKYVAKDYSQLKSWEKRLEATCLDDIFGHNTTTVNFRDCDRTLIEVLMRLTSKSSLFFRELEINILD